jgi:hypothetical protein
VGYGIRSRARALMGVLVEKWTRSLEGLVWVQRLELARPEEVLGE